MPAARRPVSDQVLAKVIALAQQQGGLIRWVQVIEAGVTDSQARTLVRRGELLRVRHGVLALPDVLSFGSLAEAECRARWKSLPEFAVVSHESAAPLHGLPDVDPAEGTSVLVPRLQRGTVTDARLGTLPPEHVETRAGVLVTSAARTVVDLMRCAEDELAAQVVADGAARVGVGSDDVAEVLAYCAGWPGIVQARSAWAHADARAESVLESRHRAQFRRLGLPQPEIQVTIVDAGGTFVARVDFLFRAQRTVVESDGRMKYLGADSAREEQRRDGPRSTLWEEKKREDRIRDTGLEVVRATWADSEDGGAHLDGRVRRAFARAARWRAA